MEILYKNLGINKMLQFINPLMQSITGEADECKTAFIGKVPDIAKFLIKNGGYKEAVHQLVSGFLFTMVSDSVKAVRDEAVEALTSICELLEEDDKINVVLAFILEIAKDQDNPDNRIFALSMMTPS